MNLFYFYFASHGQVSPAISPIPYSSYQFSWLFSGIFIYILFFYLSLIVKPLTCVLAKILTLGSAWPHPDATPKYVYVSNYESHFIPANISF